MARKATGTVTGANLTQSNRGKKGGLTGSKRVTGSPVETQNSIPTSLPETSSEYAEQDARVRANLAEKLQQGVQVAGQIGNQLGQYASQVSQSIKSGSDDHNPSSLTDGNFDYSGIISKADAEVDDSIPKLTNAEAIARNTAITQQRNYVGVAINKTKLKQDLATLDLEQKRLIGLLIDGKTAHVNNEKKAVQYHRAVVSRDTEISKLTQDRELLTQQQIRTEGTQQQTEPIREQEQLKVQKLREEVEKQKYEIEGIQYEKEKLKQEVVARFTAGF